MKKSLFWFIVGLGVVTAGVAGYLFFTREKPSEWIPSIAEESAA